MIWIIFIDYSTWKRACDSLFNESNSRLSSYLQTFPFSKINEQDKHYISSKDFYNKKIKNANWLLDENNFLNLQHYFYNSDGTYRYVKLVSPIMFLAIQCIGFYLHDSYRVPNNIYREIFYAGDFSKDESHYWNSYNRYKKTIKLEKDMFTHFIKLDFEKFYNNISLDKLFELLINSDIKNKFKKIENLTLIKNILFSIGNGKFPTIEVSSGLSYIASVIYVDDAEKRLIKILKKDSRIYNFKIFRYVDDTYITLNLDNFKELKSIYMYIYTNYNSILREFNLVLNPKKCKFDKIDLIEDYLNSNIGSSISEEDTADKNNLYNSNEVSITGFLKKLALLESPITTSEYNLLIKEYFKSNNEIDNPNRIYNSLIIKKTQKVDNNELVEVLSFIINNNPKILYLDPKRLTDIILNTANGRLIRNMLNNIFLAYKNDEIISYDVAIILRYLTKRDFRHRDVINMIKSLDSEMHDYYLKFIFDTNWPRNENIFINTGNKISDSTMNYLYGMYLCEKGIRNYFNFFAYYKTFFDRYSAWIDNIDLIGKRTKPDFKKYFKINHFITIFGNKYCHVIQKADKLRNFNPMIHSGAQLIDNLNYENEIDDIIKQLQDMILDYLHSHKNSLNNL